MPTFLLSADFWKLIGAVGFVALFFGWGLHERELGKRIEQQAALKVAAAQVIHDTEVNARADVLAQSLADKYKAVVAAPISIAAPHLRVCVSAGPPVLSALSGAGRGDHAAAAQSGLVQGPDLGPRLDHRFAVLDAQVSALQGYIHSCQAAGRCAVTPP